jgi:hypothetical protein
MITHLEKHRTYGHNVPDDAFEELAHPEKVKLTYAQSTRAGVGATGHRDAPAGEHE